ncbi:hypothetical protein N665_0104s0094 [Sinapis alba]|nr:hypothetical protein N665_0104s0094 [Sinapis alba]
MKSVGKMGKYIKKSKLDGESLALMDVSPSPLGVLTRAKSLALQRRLQKPSPSASPSKQKTADCGGGGGGGSYLQLRSRRLQKKPPIVVIRRRKKQRRVRNPNPNPQNQDSGRGSVASDGSRSDSVAESAVSGKAKDFNGEINMDELQGSESRTTRESTPCSLMRKPETITSPGSSRKLNNGISDNSNEREESFSGSRGQLPTTPEMDEFFSGAEEEQQKQFIDKYNFDPVNEQPLPGRFEWKKVDD